ncbi:MAG: MBL fold metallo-hydrolase [Oligoflexales bacterium]
MQIETFYDEKTHTLTYLVIDPDTRDTVVIDPVWDYDQGRSLLSCTSAKRVVDMIESRQLRPVLVLETHAHADHISSAQWFKKMYGIPIAIGERITEVQTTFKDPLGFGGDFTTDGKQFDHLLRDGQKFSAGSLTFEVIATPGHTPACSCYRFGNHIFTGDCLFMPDSGTGRCDFPGGSASELYNSVARKLYKLPDDVLAYTGHDYQPAGRSLKWQSSIAEQKASNIHIKETTTEDEYVQFRTQRDRTLSPPQLLYQSLFVNLNGGTLPPKNKTGRRFLQIPISEG